MLERLQNLLGITKLEGNVAKLSLEVVLLRKKIASLEDERKGYQTELAMLKKLKDDKPKMPAFQYRRVG